MTSSTQIPAAHKEWARHLRALCAGDVAITSYYDDNKKNKIDIFTSINNEGVVAATVGLMEFNQSGNSKVDVYTEIIMDRRGYDNRISNILSTIAFYVMKNGWKVAPGVIFENMVDMYISETKLPHVMFVAPFQWDNMGKLNLSDRTIYPLVAIPISENERLVASSQAGRDLESIWIERSVDVLDWLRNESV